MSTFRLNLMKGQVPGFRKRRALFWMMHLYISLAGLLMTYVTFMATHEVAAAHRVARDARFVKEAFQERFTTDKEMPIYLQDLARDVLRQMEILHMTQSTMDQRLLLSPVVAGLAIPLDDWMTLARFELRGGGAFELDLTCHQETGARIDASLPIAAWRSDEKLTSIVPTIKPAMVQRQLIEARNQILFKYEGNIKPGAI